MIYLNKLNKSIDLFVETLKIVETIMIMIKKMEMKIDLKLNKRKLDNGL